MKFLFLLTTILVLGSCGQQEAKPGEFNDCDTVKYIHSLMTIFENESKYLINQPLYNMNHDTIQLLDLLSSDPILFYVIKVNSCLACVQKNLLVLKEYLNTNPDIKISLIVESLQIRDVYSYYLKYGMDCPIYLAKPNDMITNNIEAEGEMLFLLDSTLRVNLFFEPVYQEPLIMKAYLYTLGIRWNYLNNHKYN